MGKKIGYFILILILLTVVVNIILGLIGVFLPVNFTMPEGLVEAPRDYTFIIGNMKLNLNQTILNTWAIMAIIITIITLGTRKLIL